MIDVFTWIFQIQGGWRREALVSAHWGPFVFTEGKHPGIHKSSLTEFRSPTKFPSDHLSSFAGLTLIVFQSKWVNWRTFSSAGGRLDLRDQPERWGWVGGCGDRVSGVWQDPCGRCCQVRLISTKKMECQFIMRSNVEQSLQIVRKMLISRSVAPRFSINHFQKLEPRWKYERIGGHRGVSCWPNSRRLSPPGKSSTLLCYISLCTR